MEKSMALLDFNEVDQQIQIHGMKKAYPSPNPFSLTLV